MSLFKKRQSDVEKDRKELEDKLKKENDGLTFSGVSSGTRMGVYSNHADTGSNHNPDYYGGSYHITTGSGTTPYHVSPDQWHYTRQTTQPNTTIGYPGFAPTEQPMDLPKEPEPPSIYGAAQQLILAIMGETIMNDEEAYREVEQRLYRAMLEADLSPEEVARIMGERGYKTERCPKCDTRVQEPNDYLCRECR